MKYRIEYTDEDLMDVINEDSDIDAWERAIDFANEYKKSENIDSIGDVWVAYIVELDEDYNEIRNIGSREDCIKAVARDKAYRQKIAQKKVKIEAMLEAIITHKDKMHRDGSLDIDPNGFPKRNYYLVLPNEKKPIKIIHKGKTFRGRHGIGDYVKCGTEYIRVYINTDVYDHLGELVLVLTNEGWQHKYEPQIVGNGNCGRWIYASSDRINLDIL